MLRQGLPCPPVRLVMMLTTRALQVSSPPPMKSKLRVICSYPTLKVYVYDIGHVQSTQPNIPKQFFTGSLEHAQRMPLSKHVHRTC